MRARALTGAAIALSSAAGFGCPGGAVRSTPPDIIAAPATIAGAWEGELPLPGAPARLELVFTVTEGLAGESWSGTLSGPGFTDLPVAALVVSVRQVSFTVTLETEVGFTGSLEPGGLALVAHVDKSEIPISMVRIPALSKPRDREEAWRQDIAVLRDRFLRFDRSFSDEARGLARSALEDVAARVARLDDAHVTLELSKIIASAGNAHTRLYLLRNRMALRRLPVRLWWFGNDLRVVRVSPAHREILGCTVTAIAGVPVSKLAAAIAPLFAGNASWKRYKNTYFMTSPEVLGGLDLLASTSRTPKVAVSVRCRGEGTTALLEAPPLVATDQATEAWRDLLPVAEGEPWVGASAAALPGYLDRGSDSYFVERHGGGAVLHIHYRRAQEKAGAPFSEFADEVRAGLGDEAVVKVVVDLRLNTGGDLELAWKLFEEIAAHPNVASGTSLVVLTSRATFSAGITHVAQLVAGGKARVVGEPVGDELDTWAEGGNLVLPNSRLTAHFTTGFHGYSTLAYPEREPMYKNLDVATLEPMIRVEPTWTDYARGRDPVLRAALEL